MSKKKIPIFDTEHQLRKEAIEYATASVQLEGFTFPPGDKELVQAYINGEIELSYLTTLSYELPF